MTFHTESRLAHTGTGTGTRTRGGTVTRLATTRRGGMAGAVIGLRIAAARVRGSVRTIAGWLGETVSPAGALLLAVAVAGVAGGLAFGWIEAWAAAGISLALLLCCVPFLLGSHDYRLELVLDRDRVVAGNEVGARLGLLNAGRGTSLPGIVDIPVGAGLVEVHAPLLRAGARHDERLAISAERRGIIDVGPMTISRGDPIGILRREQRWPEVQRIHVHPRTVHLPSTSSGLIRDLEGLPTGKLVNDDLSFHTVREYVRGDSQRHVHWKATAKTGRIMVRQYEESRHARIAVLLDTDLDEFDGEEEFETAVSAAASLALQAVREGRDVSVCVGGPLPEFGGDVFSLRTLPTLTPRALLDAMAGVEGVERATPIEAAAALTAQAASDLSMVFLIAGSRTPVQRLRQAAVALPPGVAVVAVRCELGAEPAVRSTREVTMLTLGALGDLSRMLARKVLG
ncbi:DUF58 domain-containing protein [Agromyces sp. CFH 90414]|uniref:DUF58 domain-containing protein n=1 Tax=Agromyces agglutinans TaxID=2662258 RepID=A0A6I2F8L0_9MICO|nr:DUF58 domain-containing protein [Agromyces agglutinans]MRG61795.1 DUF58 domain-containing protein [Agromyces agglutinans]